MPDRCPLQRQIASSSTATLANTTVLEAAGALNTDFLLRRHRRGRDNLVITLLAKRQCAVPGCPAAAHAAGPHHHPSVHHHQRHQPHQRYRPYPPHPALACLSPTNAQTASATTPQPAQTTPQHALPAHRPEPPPPQHAHATTPHQQTSSARPARRIQHTITRRRSRTKPGVSPTLQAPNTHPLGTALYMRPHTITEYSQLGGTDGSRWPLVVAIIRGWGHPAVS